MPRAKRVSIGRRTRNAVNQRTIRASQNEDQRDRMNMATRSRNATVRLLQSQEDRALQNEEARLRTQRARAAMDRSVESSEQINVDRRRSNLLNVHERLAFHYNPTINYTEEISITIGSITIVCRYCRALKFPNESKGLCCAGGKIKLPALSKPPEPFNTLMSGAGNESKHFLKNIQQYNNCFQMTSFGATNIVTENFMPAFKVIYLLFRMLTVG